MFFDVNNGMMAKQIKTGTMPAMMAMKPLEKAA